MSRDPRTSDFFVAGGTLHPDTPSYVERPADDELFNLALAGEYCYVLTPRQMGKSSLMVRTAQRLKGQGIRTAIIDLTEIGTVRADAWHLDLITELTRALRLSVDPEAWWQAQASLGPTRRFMNFLRDVVLTEIENQVVIFIDEIDSTLRLEFSDDFFAAIRAMYNARSRDSKFERLTFVLLGVASPSDLIKDRTRTPFNIGQGIALRDFSRDDAAVLQAGLEAILPGQGEVIFARIYHWTGGHPYLTQKICQTVARTEDGPWPDERIDGLVEELFLSKEASKEANLEFVRDRILTHPQQRQLLGTYRKVYEGKRIADDVQSPLQNHLKLSGLVKAEDGYLRVRNEIYRRVFDLAWVRENIAVNWAPIVAGIAVFVALLAVGSILYNAWVGIQFRDCIASFYQAKAPEERVAHLARIFRLRGLFGPTDYDYQARELFYGLSREEQLPLFGADNVQDSDLIVVIEGLYITLADIDGTDSTRPLLEAMAKALGDLDATEETKKLQGEISSWLEGRKLANQNQYADALVEYTKSVELNGENPATLYERARVLTELSEYQQALGDLDQVVAIAGRAPAPTPTAVPTDTPDASSPSTTTFAALSPSPTMSATLPMLTSTSTLVPSADITPSETSPSSVTTTLAPSPISTETPMPTNTPLPTHTPTPAAITSEFATTGQMISAVRNIIYGNPDLVSSLASASSSEYSNLREFGLVLPVISIIKPTQKVPCPLADECVFPVVGTSTNVVTSSQTIVIFVDPGGGNWWPQDLDFPLTIHSSGDWEGKAQIGDEPQPSGTEFHIIALLMNKTQVPITKQPYQELPPSITASGPIRLECDTCFYVNIISPQGAHNRPDAQSFPVSNNVEISWEPSDCVMIVQYYQNDELKGEYRSVASGTEINIGDLGSGETEIKIWREGFEEQSDSIWVWVDSTLIPEPPPTDTPEPMPTNTPTVVPTAIPVVAMATETPTATKIPMTSTPPSTVTPTTLPTATQLLTGKITFPVYQGDQKYIYLAELGGMEPTITGFTWDASEPALSPDGSQIAFRSWNDATRGLMVMNVSDLYPRRVSRSLEDACPYWALGESLVFHSTREGSTPRLHTVGTWEGAEKIDSVQYVMRGAEPAYGQYPAWVPDGRIVYKYFERNGNFLGLYIMNSDGSNPMPITDHSGDTVPSVSPRGDQVAFMSNRNGRWEVYVVNIDGSRLRRLTASGDYNSGLPTWSPDGRYIAFVSDRGNQWAIWIIKSDGSDERKLFDLDGTLTWVERISWAP